MKRFHFLKDTCGVAVVMVALFMVVLIGFCAIAIDGGKLYTEKSKLQKAIDASVLGGAQYLIKTSDTSPEEAAIDLSTKNGYPINTTVDYLNTDSNSIEVSKTIPVNTIFAKVLGISQVNVNATAKAQIGFVKSAYNGSPVAVTPDQLNKTELLCENPGSNKGNCGFLDLGGNGKNPNNGVEYFILNGGFVPLNQLIDTETGIGQSVFDAFQKLIDADDHEERSYCSDPIQADCACKRVIIVTVIQEWDHKVLPIDFVAFWIEKVGPTNSHQIYGKFLRDFVISGDFGTPPDGVADYNVYDIKLVK